MGATLASLLTVLYLIIAIIVVIVLVVLTIRHINRQYEDTLTQLERDKNLIISGSILAELNKVEALINNKELEDKYNYWKSIFKEIKDTDVPKITDELITAEERLKRKDKKGINDELARIEFEIYIAKSKASKLLDNIKEITLSEQKNREIVTKLKADYRSIFLQYNNSNKSEYKMIETPIDLQFENIDKLFSAFEMAMENNVYSEVGKIVKALDDSIGNLKMVIEESPSIILMGETMIPAKIADVKKIQQKMLAEGYNLDYLKIDYNIQESEKKVADIFDRLKVLNLEDSIFELRTILDYFDKLYQDFEKEKIAKKLFDDYIRTVILKCKKLKKIVSDLSSKIQDIKYSFDLTDDDVKIIGELNTEILSCEEAYEKTMADYRSKEVQFSKLTNHMEITNSRLQKAEEKLDFTLRRLGSLKEDELRARDQLVEIKSIYKQSSEHMNTYKLPIIPKDYFVQREEAEQAMQDMILELEKKPISIKTLNVRVDTARDLVLKLYNTSINIVKCASMAENAIVYGNRYRALNKEIDNSLYRAERYFFKGDYNDSLREAIRSINVIEPGIQDRLLEEYNKEES